MHGATHTHIPTHSLEEVKWVRVDSAHLSDKADPREQHTVVLLIEQLPHGRHIHLHQVRHLTNYPHCTQGSLQVHVCETGVQWQTQWRPMGKWPFTCTWHCTLDKFLYYTGPNILQVHYIQCMMVFHTSEVGYPHISHPQPSPSLNSWKVSKF